MIRQKRFRVMMLLAMAALPAGASADTLLMPMFSPITFADRVDMKYTIVADASSNPIGKFTATGRAVSIDGITMTPKGTLLVQAYFNPTTGEIYKDHSNDLFDPLLEVKNGSAVMLYTSTLLHRFAYDLSVIYPTFDFEFFNEGGTLAAASPIPYIGATLRNASTFTGTQSFISNLPIGSTVFDNTKNVTLNLEMGTANVFMTPTPTAIAGGIMLLGSIGVVGTLRRRVVLSRAE